MPWNGAVYALAMYDKALTAAEVAQNFAARLPDSPPVVRSLTARVKEDGNAAPPKKQPLLYLVYGYLGPGMG